MRLAAVVAIFLAFTGWTLWSVGGVGLGGLLGLLQGDPWGRQVFVDLCISITVAWTFMYSDSRARRLPFWPYVLGSVAVGSIAILAWLIHREVLMLRRQTT